MYRASIVVLIIAVFVLCAMPAMAFDAGGLHTARTSAMGGGLSAVPNDETAHLTNPAGLPNLSTFGLGVSPWPSRASLSVSLDAPAGLNYVGGFYAARDAARISGWGASFQNDAPAFGGANVLGLGYGRRIGGQGLTAGVSLTHATNGSDATMLGLGFMYQQDLPLQSWRLGLMINDLTDDLDVGGARFDVGASVQLPEGVLLAATIFDLTDELDRHIGFGAEWPIPMSPVTLRAGLHDGDFGLGAGYRWSNFDLSLSWQDFDTGDMVIITGTGAF